MMSKEKQIEEMAKAAYPGLDHQTVFSSIVYAQPLVNLYNADYRKQSEGEWIKDNTSKFKNRYNCSVCDYRFFGIPTPYCPKCGARMKGGE